MHGDRVPGVGVAGWRYQGMSYFAEWVAISTRIQGLVRAAELLSGWRLSTGKQDPYNTVKLLLEEGIRIRESLKDFRDLHGSALPANALHILDDALSGFFAKIPTGEARDFYAIKFVVLFATFNGRFSFALRDVQETIRRRSERAFAHLQRTIEADPTVRAKWQLAFTESGEIACEKLGAAHLLLHGIWAFKVSSEGARTDLVFGDVINMLDVERSAEGLVMTEWKVAREGDVADKKFEEARLQAENYASGALSGIELNSFRYAIVVSDRQVCVPNDTWIGTTLWRHINIPISPMSPSRYARRPPSR